MSFSQRPEVLVLSAILVPFMGALLIPLFHRVPNLREAVTLATAGALFLTVLGLLGLVLAGARPEALHIEVVPGLALAFKVEPLGMLFAVVASALWIVNSIYSIGYMRATTSHGRPPTMSVLRSRWAAPSASPLPRTCSRCSCSMKG
jgi:formate hydrogenlyase subunit 3/multisubunit Na+/H+ antiporter MnhD subunit